MKLKDIFFGRKARLNAAKEMETKTQGTAGFNPLISPTLYLDGEKPVLYPSEAVLYMMGCAPVWTALHRIAESVASIKPKVRNKKTGEFVEHDVLKLLEKPDADITFSEFIENCIQWYAGTGNVYIRAIGYKENPPLSLRVMPSHSTSAVTAGDGYPDKFITRLLMISDVYKRFEVTEYGRERYRYYANDFNELYQIRTFNPQVGSSMVYGLSPLNAVFYEMRQYIEAAKSNMSSLIRTSRLGGIWKYSGTLIDEQKQRLESQINSAYSGTNNSGRQAILDTRMEYQDLSKTNRDMEYIETAKHTAEVIYKALNIPLPLIESENMTYSNYEIAQYAFYKDAVIPLRKRLDQELTNFLLPRYDKEDLFEICFNPKEIPQLEPERNAQIKIKKDTSIYTINELRKETEYEPLDGGQYVYGTMGAIPIATDINDEFTTTESQYSQSQNTQQANEANTQELQQQSESEAEAEKSDKIASKEDFIRRLKLQVNKDGTSRFTEDEINYLANKHFGE